MNKIKNGINFIFTRMDRSPALTVFFFFALTLLTRYFFSFLMWYLTNFPFQRSDPYIYILKAFEILKGDWSPIHTHSIGWPMTLALFFKFFARASLFENMISASLLAILFSASAIFPLIDIAKKTGANFQTRILLIAFFCFSFPLTIIETSGAIVMSEHLFVLLFLYSIAFLYTARNRPLFLILSASIAGCAYWVRPNGIFILPIILISYWLWKKDTGYSYIKTLIASFFAFWVVSLPFLYQRLIWFGSAFDYGENSKYFSDTYTDAWGSAFPTISLNHYLSTHNILQWFEKFGIGGIGLTATALLIAVAPHILMTLCNLFENRGNKTLYPIWIACSVWIIGLMPVFHIYYTPRHIMPLVPLIMLVSALQFSFFMEKRPDKDMLAAAAIVAAALFMVLEFSFLLFMIKERAVQMPDGARWASYLSTTLKGKVAIGNGSDILMMQLPDTHIGGRSMFNIIAPQSGIEVIYPGKVNNLSVLTDWFRINKIDYLVLDDMIKKGFSYAPDKYLSIYTGEKLPLYLKQIYSNYETNSQWKVRVFSVDKKMLLK